MRRAQTELSAAGADREAAQALAREQRAAPPAQLLALLKQQPPSSVVQGGWRAMLDSPRDLTLMAGDEEGSHSLCRRRQVRDKRNMLILHLHLVISECLLTNPASNINFLALSAQGRWRRRGAGACRT